MNDEVLRDLVDAVLQEGLATVEVPAADGGWGRVGTLRVRLHDGGALQRYRAVPGAPVLDDRGAPVAPADAVAALGLDGPGAADLAADLTSTAEHAAVLNDVERSAGLLGGERRMAPRGRPFHPTARAVSGWTADEVRTFGPTRTAPLACAWVAVARDHLRLGPDPSSADLAAELLDDDDRARLAATGFDDRTHQPLPVHPWQHVHVLHREFAPEIAAGLVVPLGVELGRFHPTASWRTLALADDPRRHLKLPLGAATLGAARLLPPRYLENGDRAQRLLLDVLGDDVEVCDEGTWAGWSDGEDEFADRPGHLAAQVRRYPDDLDGITLPLGALAAHAWDELGPDLGVDDPLAFFGGLADAFTTMVVGFLARGVLPEVHGQNVVVRLAPDGAVLGFVLRDHDTVRIHPPWLTVADPGYRIRPGAGQTLCLDTPDELVGYAQTLGFQVALYGVADALARHHALPERPFWDRLRVAVERAPDLRPEIAHLLLGAPTWPSRTLVGPLLARGRSGSVSMPAGAGRVPNPLRGGHR